MYINVWLWIKTTRFIYIYIYIPLYSINDYENCNYVVLRHSCVHVYEFINDKSQTVGWHWNFRIRLKISRYKWKIRNELFCRPRAESDVGDCFTFGNDSGHNKYGLSRSDISGSVEYAQKFFNIIRLTFHRNEKNVYHFPVGFSKRMNRCRPNKL